MNPRFRKTGETWGTPNVGSVTGLWFWDRLLGPVAEVTETED